MPTKITEDSNRALVCSVVFLDVVGYSKLSVAGQMQLKKSFNRIVAESLQRLVSHDYTLLDTGDGAAITFHDAEDALFIAMSIRDTVGDLKVRIGVHLGPVRLLRDLNGQINIVGDAINSAQRVMSFCEPGQLLVSRAYHDVVARLTTEYEKLFVHAGAHADKHQRAHDVYAVIEGVRAPRRVHASEARQQAWRNAGGASEAHQHAAAQYTFHEIKDQGSEQPAQVFDAGSNIVVSGYSQSRVQEALERLAAEGSRVLSPITKVGDKWMASCEHPTAGVSACKVEDMGYTRMVTGPTREAVEQKVRELIDFGAVLVGEIEFAGGAWMGVCDTSGANR